MKKKDQETILEKEKSIAKEAGGNVGISAPKWFGFITAKIFSYINAKSQDRELMRRKLGHKIYELIEKINVLLKSAEEQLKIHGKRGLIFMMDSLDRLNEGISKELFIENGRYLRDLKGNFIFVANISLLYDEPVSFLEFDHEILPMIPVFKSGTDHIPHEDNIKQLKELIGKRVVVNAIFTEPEESLRELILTSGGHLRDLIKLLQYALGQTDDRIQPGHAEYAMNRLMTDYEKIVKDDQYEYLVNVYYEQDAPNDVLSQEFIYGNVILFYRKEDGSEWKDVHPAVVRNKKFQKALKT
ncbi:MAG: hypothetical protein PVH61_27515 [Candidatus Aminicenantes bacterium]|jgi:hypothetical protein